MVAIDDATVAASGCLNAGQDPVPAGVGDHYFVRKVSESLTYSDAEAEALEAWILERARALVEHRHFRWLADHVAEALERDGELDEEYFVNEVERAELRYRNQIPDSQPRRST